MSYRSFGEFVDAFVNNGKVFIELDLGDREFFSSDRARELAANLLAAAEYAEATQRGDMTRAEAEAEAKRVWGPMGGIHDRLIDAYIPLSKRTFGDPARVVYRYWVGSSGNGAVQPHVCGNGNTWAEAFANAKSDPNYKERRAK